MPADAAAMRDGTGAARGRLVVLAGPSAVGKSTVVRRLRERIPSLYFSVSATTRAPRAGEQDGVDYHFVGAERFEEMIARGELLEWADIHGGMQRSGTPAEPVDRARTEGRPVLVEVDLAGVRQVRRSTPDALFVFLAPPSWDELVRRLTARGTETGGAVQRRLETARDEMAARDEFDTVVVNDDLDRAVEQLVALLVEDRPKTTDSASVDTHAKAPPPVATPLTTPAKGPEKAAGE